MPALLQRADLVIIEPHWPRKMRAAATAMIRRNVATRPPAPALMRPTPC